jgi:hypothetical protein
MSVAELRKRAKDHIDGLSPRSLRTAAEFLAFLEAKENLDATEELVAIPGFLERFKNAKREAAKGPLVDWRKVRHDV